MKILINGYYGFGNFGDDLLVLFFTRLIKKYYTNDEVYIFSNASSNNPDFKMKENYNDYLIKLTNIEKKYIIDWTYKGHFDIVINGGGGTFFDYTEASILKKIINNFINIFNPRTIFYFEKLVRKILRRYSNISFDRNYAIGNNIGPFDTNSKRFIQLYSRIGSIDKFLVRDLESKKYLNKFSYKIPFEEMSDVVFCNSYFPEITEKELNNNIKTIGIIIMDWNYKGQQYLKKFEELSQQLEKRNIKTELFSFSEMNDCNLQKYSKNKIHFWKPNVMNIENYLKKLSSVDCIISMRFHGLVIATIQNIPSIGIGINNKIIDYVNQTKKVNHLVNQNFIVSELIEKIEFINKEYSYIKKNIKEYKDYFSKTENIIENFIEGELI